MSALTKHLTPKALGMLLALATLAALAVLLLSHNAAQADPPAPVPLSELTPAEAWAAPVPEITEVDADVTSDFALFRDGPPSGMPADVAAQMASPDHYGRNADLARAIDTPYGQGWIVPGDDYLCIVVPDPVAGYGEGCSPVETALTRGLWLRMAGDGPSATALDTVLAPDGRTAQLGGGAVTASQDADGVTSADVAPDDPLPAIVATGG